MTFWKRKSYGDIKRSMDACDLALRLMIEQMKHWGIYFLE
jgi:hypothetical protein